MSKYQSSILRGKKPGGNRDRSQVFLWTECQWSLNQRAKEPGNEDDESKRNFTGEGNVELANARSKKSKSWGSDVFTSYSATKSFKKTQVNLRLRGKKTNLEENVSIFLLHTFTFYKFGLEEEFLTVFFYCLHRDLLTSLRHSLWGRHLWARQKTPLTTTFFLQLEGMAACWDNVGKQCSCKSGANQLVGCREKGASEVSKVEEEVLRRSIAGKAAQQSRELWFVFGLCRSRSLDANDFAVLRIIKVSSATVERRWG